MLMGARVIQGLGGALMLPVGRLVVLRAYPRSELVRIMGFITIPGLLGPLIGPTMGGWMVEYLTWHWIFLINLPVGRSVATRCGNSSRTCAAPSAPASMASASCCSARR